MGVCQNERPLAMVLCDTELCMNAKRRRVFKIPTLCFLGLQCYVFLFKERATLETKYSVSKNAGLWISAPASFLKTSTSVFLRVVLV